MPGRPRLAVGTSGYAYKEWKGSFYPADLPAAQMLGFYAARLPAVEVNNTFYRLPSEETLRRWAGEVPAAFTFALKASQRITHHRRLKGAEETLSYLLATAATLGDRLGPILFQLPPNLKLDLPRLQAFLAVLPATVRAAFEFRHPSWFEEGVFAALAERGAALCVADFDGGPPVRRATAGWGYLRLRREDYGEPELAAWASWIAQQAWSDAWAFFKHEDAGAGPRLAMRLIEAYSVAGEVPVPGSR